MKVLSIALNDNGQQSYLLAKAMRDYLDWDARSITFSGSYLNFPTDWTAKNVDEALAFAQDADLLIFQDAMIWDENFDVRKLAGPRNTIINGTGSMMRRQLNDMLMMQYRGWVVVPPLCDETLSSKMMGIPFENWIVPTDTINELTRGIVPPDDIVCICHAPTKKAVKGTEMIESILEPMIERGDIKYTRIEGMSWEEALREKAKNHIVLDSFGNLTATYGAGNALEGLALGQEVISKISPWAYALHPDLPVITTFGRDVREVIEKEVSWQKYNGCKPMEAIVEHKKEWVQKHFSPENQIVKWKNFTDWMMTRETEGGF